MLIKGNIVDQDHKVSNFCTEQQLVLISLGLVSLLPEHLKDRSGLVDQKGHHYLTSNL